MRYKIIVIVFSVFICGSCSIEDIFNPEEKDGELIASEVILPEGGKLETDDFKLIIPYGTFEQSTELKLFIDENDSPNNNSVSPTYLLEGIPDYFNDSLEISIKYHGALEGLNLMERRVEAEVSTVDSVFTDIAVFLIEAKEKDGFLTAKLPPPSPSSESFLKSSQDESKKWYITVNSKGSNLVAPHFKLLSSDFNFNANPDLYRTIADYFVAAFKRFEKLEFDLSELGTTIKIPIKKTHNPFRIVVNRVTGDLHIEMDENPTIPDYSDLFAYSLAQSILTKYHFIYDNWPTEGICQWTRYQFKDTELKNEINDSFNSSLLSYDSDGIISMIDFLADIYGEDILSKIVKDMAPYIVDELDYEGLSGIEAVQKNTEPAGEWLTDYYLHLLTSEKWRNRIKRKTSSLADFWSRMAASETLIESTTDQIIWTESYEDLSAKLFRVALSSNLMDNSSLDFIIEGGDTELSILKFRNDQFELISTSEERIRLSDIKEFALNGYDLFVLIASTQVKHQGINKSDIKLTIEHSYIPTITSCSIHLEDIDVNIRKYWDDGTYTDDVRERHWMGFYTEGEPAPPPTFENNVFYQAYTFTDDRGYDISGNISVKFNETLDSVLTFSAEYKSDGTMVDERFGTSEQSISGHDLPLYDSNTFKVTGMETCDKLNNNLRYYQNNAAVVTWDILNIKACRPDSDNWPSSLMIKITTK